MIGPASADSYQLYAGFRTTVQFLNGYKGSIRDGKWSAIHCSGRDSMQTLYPILPHFRQSRPWPAPAKPSPPGAESQSAAMVQPSIPRNKPITAALSGSGLPRLCPGKDGEHLAQGPVYRDTSLEGHPPGPGWYWLCASLGAEGIRPSSFGSNFALTCRPSE